MAIKPETEFVGKINAADANYDLGSAREITSPSDGTGTPWKARLINDLWGFFQKILNVAGITPSGSPDTILASDYFDGLMTLVPRPTLTVATMTAIVGVRAGNIFKVAERTDGNGGGACWLAITTGTTPDVDLPNTFDIVVGVVDPLISFKLIVNQTMNTAMFGALHNATPGGADGTDDTDAIQRACDRMSGESFWLISSAGTASIDAVNKNINIPKDIYLTFMPTSEWRAITNASDSYIVLDIRDVTNVYIYNPRITGDKTTHTGSTGEQGHCINISEPDVGDTSNIHIYNPICSNTWGDGIVIRKGSNLHFYNAVCDEARRNGITINKGINVHFHGTTVATNTNGIAPEAGLDIEPNDATGELKNIMFDRLVTGSNVGPGCTLNLGDFPGGGSDKEVSITILEHIDRSSIYGLNVEKMGEGVTEKITGSIRFGKQIYTLNKSCGVYFNDYTGNNSPVIYLDELTIINPNFLNSSSSLFGAGFGIDRKIGSGLTNTIGNCVVNKLRIVDNLSVNKMTRGIAGFDNDGSGAALENFKIIDPIEISGFDNPGDAVHVAYKGMELTDKYLQVERVLSGSLSITSRSQSRVSTSNASLFTLTDGIAADNSGMPLELFTTGTGGIKFTPSGARAVLPISTVNGVSIQSTDKGARLKLELNIADSTWYVLEKIGNWGFVGSKTFDPASIVNNASLSTTVTATGALLGDYTRENFGLDLQGLTLNSYVSAANTITCVFTNNTGGAIDLGSATLEATAFRGM